MTKKPSRIYVEMTVLEDIDLEKPLEVLIEELNCFKNTWNEYRNLYIDNEGCINYPNYVLRGERLENDIEYNKRMKLLQKEKEKKRLLKEKREKEDRKEYERLKKRFEKGN